MIVRDIGPRDASIMLVGEAPGSEEAAKGIPFVGQSGKLLRAMCYATGINFEKCYVTNIMSERPPGNNFGYFYEDRDRAMPKKSLELAWEALGKKIQSIAPKVVICLGDEALRAVTNKQGIGAWRGTRIEVYGTKVIATWHPASILRDFTSRGKEPGKQQMAYRKVVSEMDLRKAKREAEGLVYVEPEIITAPTFEQTISWLQGWTQGCRLAHDIETVGKAVRCIGFAGEGSKGITAICIPFFRMIQSTPVMAQVSTGVLKTNGGVDINYWSKDDEVRILHAIAHVLEDGLIEKVGQNAIHFDNPLIKAEFGIEVNNYKMDTMHAWHVLYPALPKGLDFICSMITDHPNYWTEHDTQVDSSEWYYNAMDATVTLEASRKIDKELEECKT